MEGQASLRLSGRVQTLWRAAQRCSGVIGHGGVASPTSTRRIFTQRWRSLSSLARLGLPLVGLDLLLRPMVPPSELPPTSPPDQGKFSPIFYTSIIVVIYELYELRTIILFLFGENSLGWTGNWASTQVEKWTTEGQHGGAGGNFLFC